uniref:Uncharacterized protein n=1 Tax=Anguilla anguilla TaxID=7936 RepID=A0A0E9TUT1_ANGAN
MLIAYRPLFLPFYGERQQTQSRPGRNGSLSFSAKTKN